MPRAWHHASRRAERASIPPIEDRLPHYTEIGYEISQVVRRRIEAIFGWLKSFGGLRRTRFRGLAKTAADRPPRGSRLQLAANEPSDGASVGPEKPAEDRRPPENRPRKSAAGRQSRLLQSPSSLHAKSLQPGSSGCGPFLNALLAVHGNGASSLRSRASLGLCLFAM